jgi:hypothetical protein
MTKRERILTNYGHRCHICGHRIEGEAFDIDHLIPLARGGTDALWNLAPAHPTCNRSKQAVVAHNPADVQFSMFRHRGNGTSTPSPVTDFDAECLEWLMRARDRNNDSGLPTRFHHWVVDRARQPLTYTETQQLFLRCCQTLGIHAIVQDDRFVFVTDSR